MQIWQWVLTISGGIITLGSALTTIKNLTKPATDLVDRIKRLEAHDEKDMKRFERHEVEFAKSAKADQALYRAVLALLDHAKDGNHTGEMKKARDALNEHIIDIT